MTRTAFLKGSGVALAGAAAIGVLGACSPQEAKRDASGDDEGSGAAASAEIGLAESFDAASARYDVDLVVVGSGAAGISAAVQAGQEGGSALLVEVADALGGSTAFAEGLMGLRSKYQLNNGIDFDIEEELLADVEFSRYVASQPLLKRFFGQADEDIEWLESNGVEFHPEPNPHSPTQVFYVGQGKTMVATMADRARESGIELLTGTRAKRLHLDGGKVAGLIVEDGEGEYPIRTKAVILATGGFINNEEIFDETFPFDYGRIKVTAAPHHQGDGRVMAWAAGADDAAVHSYGWTWCGLKNFDIHSQLSTAACNEPFFWVNQTGKRFIPESLVIRFSTVPYAVIQQQRPFSILTQQEVDRLMEEGCTVGWGSYIFAGEKLTDLQSELDAAKAAMPEGFYYADSLAALAAELDIAEGALAATVAEYNAMVAAGEDTEFHKPAQYLRAVSEEGPFYAFELQPNMLTTHGGLVVNDQCEVVDSSGTRIDGLYGAGVDCSGYTGFYYNDLHGGCTQAFSVFSGRTAASNALAYAAA
jgi:fumarate reductase flavoprotein subunit